MSLSEADLENRLADTRPRTISQLNDAIQQKLNTLLSISGSTLDPNKMLQQLGALFVEKRLRLQQQKQQQQKQKPASKEWLNLVRKRAG